MCDVLESLERRLPIKYIIIIFIIIIIIIIIIILLLAVTK